MVTKEIFRHGLEVITTLTGHPKEVDAAVNEIQDDFPAQGYATRVKEKTPLGDGTVRVVIKRNVSCD